MGPHEIFRGIPTQAKSQRTNEISPYLGPRALYKLEILINTNGYHIFDPYNGLYLPHPPHDLHNSLWVGNCIHIFRWGNCSQRDHSWPMITRPVLERPQVQCQACLTSTLILFTVLSNYRCLPPYLTPHCYQASCKSSGFCFKVIHGPAVRPRASHGTSLSSFSVL